jgi:hypothetical protein
MADTIAMIAIPIAIISLLISILNYYKSLEPTLSIRIEVEKRKEGAALVPDYTTKIIFKNDSNNKFNDLDISLALIKPAFLESKDNTISTRFMPGLYMGPKDERVVIFPSSPSDVNSLKNDYSLNTKLNITFWYKFLFQKKYEADFRWNRSAEVWEWYLTRNTNKAMWQPGYNDHMYKMIKQK